MNHFYQNIKGWFTYPKLYKEMVERFDDANFAEVGVYEGQSISFLGVEVINQNKNIKLHCIDNWNGVDIRLEQLKYNFHENTYPIRHLLNTVDLPSTEAVQEYPDEYFEFVFIDAAHDLVNVIRDIKAWYPKVKKGGVLAGHDYPNFAGVKKAVDLFFPNCKKDELCWIVQK